MGMSGISASPFNDGSINALNGRTGRAGLVPGFNSERPLAGYFFGTDAPTAGSRKGFFFGFDTLDGRNLCQATVKALRFIDGEFDHTYFDWDILANPNRVKVKVAGDVLVCVQVPIKDGTAGISRRRLALQVRVNGSNRADGYSATGYIAGISASEPGSLSLYYVVTGLSANDLIDVTIGANATNTGSVIANSEFSMLLWHLTGERVYSIRSDTGVAGTNLNATDTVKFKTSADRADSGFTLDGSGQAYIDVTTAGWYLVTVNIPLSGAITNAGIVATVKVNGTALTGGTFQNGYISNLDGDTTSTLSWTGAINFAASDRFTITVAAGANAGTVTTGSVDAQINFIAVADTAKLGVWATSTLASGTSWNQVAIAAQPGTSLITLDATYFFQSGGIGAENIRTERAMRLLTGITTAYSASTVDVLPVLQGRTLVDDALLYMAQGYVKSANGHRESGNTAISSFRERRVAGDLTSFRTQQGGPTGTVGLIDTTRLFYLALTELIEAQPTAVPAGTATAAVSASVIRQQQQFAADLTGSLFFTQASALTNNVATFSIELWFRPASIAAGVRGILGRWGNTAGLQDYRVITTADVVGVNVNNSGTPITISHPTPVLVGLWYQVVLVVDASGGLGHLYLNTVDATSSYANTVPHTGSAALQLGHATAISTSPFAGSLARVRWWNRVLSSSDVTALYRGGKGVNYLALSGGQKLNLVAAWELNEFSASGAIAIRQDSHTSALTLTNSGSPVSGIGPGSVLTQGAAVTAISVSVKKQLTIAAAATRATAAVSAKVIHQTTDGSVNAGLAHTAVAAKVVHQTTDGSVAAGLAHTSISAQVVHKAAVVAVAAQATAAVSTKVIHQTTDGSVNAGAATTSISATRIHLYTSLAVSQGLAHTAIAGKVVHQTTDGSVQASAATAAIASKVVHQTTDGSVAAGNATTAISATLSGVRATIVALQGAATAAVAAKVVHQTTDGSVAASAATTAVAAKHVHQTSMAVQASSATAAIAAKRVHQTTDGSVAAGAATASISAKRIHQTSLAVTASPATAAVSVKRVHQTTLAVQASPATTSISVQRISRSTVTALQGAAHTIFSAKVVHQTTDGSVAAGNATTAVAVTVGDVNAAAIVAHQGAATTVLAAKVVHQTTDGSVQAGNAAASIQARRVHQTSMAVAASRATAALTAKVVHRAAVTAAASSATTAIAVKRVHQTSMAVAASAATAKLLEHLVQTRIAVSAGLAHATVAAKVVHQTSMVCAASRATCAINAQIGDRTTATLAVQAGNATANTQAKVIHQTTDGSVAASAATAAITAKRVHQATIGATQGQATCAINGTRLRAATVHCQAGQATAQVIAKIVHQTNLAVQAARATCAISGRVASENATLACQQGAAHTSIAAQLIHVANANAQASRATSHALLQRIHQALTAVSAGNATAHLTGGFIYDATLAVQQGIASVTITGRLTHQTNLAARMNPALAALVAQLIHQSTFTAEASPATVIIVAGQTLTVSVTVEASPATTTVAAQVIHQTDINVVMSAARARALGYDVVWYTDAPFVILVELAQEIIMEGRPAALTLFPKELV